MDQNRYLELLTGLLLNKKPQQLEPLFKQRVEEMRKCIEAELARRKAAHPAA
ncbi:MAG TPA: hypothetical protein PKM88_02160 [bacterium]|nr:hypothetical protein [bacterium]